MVHVLHAHVEGARNPYVGRDVGIPRSTSSSSLASSSRPRRAATFLQQCSTVQLYSVLDLVQLYYSCTVVQLYSTAEYSCTTAVIQLYYSCTTAVAVQYSCSI